ncbi:hypothetical protein [Treponema pectinovorum]|uniref:hypothetical protein n=1 Tax=Treponema pectinovorum TaxID=164 RepID=UPI0011F2B3E9|nr:hypothetical protein [Treponema pectinovorum]
MNIDDGEESVYRLEEIYGNKSFLICIFKTLDEVKKKAESLCYITNECQEEDLIIYKTDKKNKRIFESYLYKTLKLYGAFR